MKIFIEKITPFILISFFPLLMYGQTQIGQNLNGDTAGDYFGEPISLSTDGNVIAVGAPFRGGGNSNSGYVRIYENQAGLWSQLGDEIVGEVTDYEFGRALSLSNDGRIVAIGTRLYDGVNNNSGQVRIYEYQSGVWTQIGNAINGVSNQDLFGNSVSLSSDGSILAIGAFTGTSNGVISGIVQIYEFQGGIWTQIGNNINGEAAGDWFGFSVSLSNNGSIVAIGAPHNDGNVNDAGHVRVYENKGGLWTQIGNDIDGEAVFDRFGYSSSLSGDGRRVAIGSNSHANWTGRVQVYENQSGIWTQIGGNIDGEAEQVNAGRVSISNNGNVVVVGAYATDNWTGRARVFEYNCGSWMQVGNYIDGAAIDNLFGITVSLSGDGTIVGIGAPRNGDNGFNSGQVKVFSLDLASNLIVTQPQDIIACDTNNDGFFEFDLTAQDSTILNGLSTTTFEVLYYASLADYTNNTPISNPKAYTNATAYTSENIIASVRNKNDSNCEASTNFNIYVFDMPMLSLVVPTIENCDNTSFGTDSDGIIINDLTVNESIILNGQSASDFTVFYYTDLAFTNQITTPSNYQNVNSTETIHVKVVNNNSTNCVAYTSFTIEVYELPTKTQFVTLIQCDDDLDGYSNFNLNEVIDEITTNAVSETITFYELQIDAENENNPISNTSSYTNKNVSSDTVWARVENTEGCFQTTEVNLVVSTTQIPLTFSRDFYECDDSEDGDSTNGISSFDFSSITAEIEALFPIGQQIIITYYRNLEDALSETNAINDITDYRNVGYPNVQDIYIRVDSALDNDCLGLGKYITLHVEPVPIANPVSIAIVCDVDGDGIHAFDTSTIESDIIGNQINTTVIYTDGNGNPLPNPLPNPFNTSSQTITARVTNSTSQDPNGACYNETTISFVVDAVAIAYPIQDLIVCDDNNDGEYAFDTSTIEETILNGQTGMIVSYFDDMGNELPSPLPNPFITSTVEITAKVENMSSTFCYDETLFNLIVNDLPEINLEDDYLICNIDPSLTLSVVPDYYSYAWYYKTDLISESNEAILYEEGEYSLVVSELMNGIACENIFDFTLSRSVLPTITDVQYEELSDNNFIEIIASGDGDFEYSIDGLTYQDSNLFSNVPGGVYTVYVRDKHGCGEDFREVTLIDYPPFFTPNGDGHNDFWQIKGITKFPNSKIYIYDRFGKLLKELSATSVGWNGTFNGAPMPSDDYWFSLFLDDGREVSGHFTLKL